MNPIPPKRTREKKINSYTLFANCRNQMLLYFVSAHFGINLKTLDRNFVQLPRGVYTHLSMSENFTANEMYEYAHSERKIVPKRSDLPCFLHRELPSKAPSFTDLERSTYAEPYFFNPLKYWLHRQLIRFWNRASM